MTAPTPEAPEQPDTRLAMAQADPTGAARTSWLQRLTFFGLISVILAAAAWAGQAVEPTWVIQKIALDPQAVENPDEAVPLGRSGLTKSELERHRQAGTGLERKSVLVVENSASEGTVYSQVTATFHFGIWSLFPAFVAITCCWTFREPLTALLMGAISGGWLLQKFDFLNQVLLPSLASAEAAGILILYLWLLGGLMGIWSRTGAAQAFAQEMAKRFVRGPRTAKLVAWGLGVLFFQGGTISTVLVGTAVRPIADQQKVSHEELSYVVDSTASPIACLIAFNAWPSYVQALLFVPGVAFLATRADRIEFFFSALPLSFYALFAVTGSLLLALDLAPFLGKRFREAIVRARTTGQLDRPGSEPLSFTQDLSRHADSNYSPHVLEFLLPLLLLTGIAIGSFFLTGSPKVLWGFGAAFLVAGGIAVLRGMSLHNLVTGIGEGLQGVVFASVILVLAVTLGDLTQAIGGGAYLVDLLGDSVPYWSLPLLLFGISVAIAFSTGSSWGTYAVTFPLAMPLAIAVAQSQALSNEYFYAMICFACVLNGSVFGDQCSPISDTTVLTAMTTGSDLMDHVTTQIVPATFAALLALLGWTAVTVLFC